MTLEENRKLKRKLKKAGYIIKDGYASPDEWTASIKTPKEFKNLDSYDCDRDKITIVDCSYDNMVMMKYRRKLNGKWEEIWDYRPMKDFDLEEVLKTVGNKDLMNKNFLIEQKIKKIEGDFV